MVEVGVKVGVEVFVEVGVNVAVEVGDEVGVLGMGVVVGVGWGKRIKLLHEVSQVLRRKMNKNVSNNDLIKTLLNFFIPFFSSN